MDRRQFLKGVGLASAAGIAGVSGLSAGALGNDRSAASSPMARQALVGAARYRIQGANRVMVSHDGGRTWARHATFAEGVALRWIRADASGVRLRATYAGHGFSLALSSGARSWVTV